MCSLVVDRGRHFAVYTFFECLPHAQSSPPPLSPPTARGSNASQQAASGVVDLPPSEEDTQLPPPSLGVPAPLRAAMDALRSAGRAMIRSPSMAKQSWSAGRHKSKKTSYRKPCFKGGRGAMFSLGGVTKDALTGVVYL